MPANTRAPQRQSQKRRRRALRRKRIFSLFMIAASVLIIAVLLFKIPPAATEYIHEETFGKFDLYKTKTVDNSEITDGDLILVNSEHAYNFDKAEPKHPIAELKNDSYLAKNDEIQLNKTTILQFNKLFSSFESETGLNNVCIISAYRDYEYQDNLFNERVAEDGYYETLNWVALPGYSEHHTGLAADIAVSDGEGNNSTFTGEDKYAFVEENAWKYGFIRRYPENKTDITGISSEPWHFRYTGKPHAYIMHTTGMCLEEYEEYVKSFVFGQKYIDVNIHGEEYKIYYIPASPEGETKLKVPLIGGYSVSGNNTDGFIVTEKD